MAIVRRVILGACRAAGTLTSAPSLSSNAAAEFARPPRFPSFATLPRASKSSKTKGGGKKNAKLDSQPAVSGAKGSSARAVAAVNKVASAAKPRVSAAAQAAAIRPTGSSTAGTSDLPYSTLPRCC